MNTITGVNNINFNGYLDRSVYKFTKKIVKDEKSNIQQKAKTAGEVLSKNELSSLSGWSKNLIKCLENLIEKYTGRDTLVACRKMDDNVAFFMRKDYIGMLEEQPLGTFEPSLKGFYEFVSGLDKDCVAGNEYALNQKTSIYSPLSLGKIK